MGTSVIQTSFSAGEVSPTLYGRVDLNKYRAGAARMRNFYVDYKGGATRRHGLQFIDQCYDSTQNVRLVPFQFSTEQTYVLEFGDEYMRVIKDGAYVLTTPRTITGITQAIPGVVTANAHGFVAGDWVYIEGVNGMTAVNGRTFLVGITTPNTFQLLQLDGSSFSTIILPAYTSGGTVSKYYKLTTPYVASDLELLKWTQNADTMTLVHPNYAPRNLTRTDHDAWTLSAIVPAADIAAPVITAATASAAGTSAYRYQVTAVSATGEESVASNDGYITGAVDITATAGANTITWGVVSGAAYYNVYRSPVARNSTAVPVGVDCGYIGSSYGTQFVDSNITPDFTQSPPRRYDPFMPGQVQSVLITAGGAGYVQSTATCTFSGDGFDAAGIPIIVGGAVVGVIITNPGKGYSFCNITFSAGGATGTVNLGPLTGTYPGVTTYFQQRQWFAASTNAPETLWASKVGAYANFDRSQPTIDSDSLELTISSSQVNDIKALIAMPGGLVVLSGSGAWQISGGDQNNAVTPKTAVASAQAYNGCSDVPPIVINYDILYVQAKGSIVRDLAYNFFANIYTGTDISILSNHLFDPRRIVEWAWAEEPHKIIWCVRDDGILLSLTYLKDQEVFGWARHDTMGRVKSVAAITEGQTDAVYFVVERVINGRTVKYVERVLCESIPDIETPVSATTNTGVEDAFYVDCGLKTDLVYPAAGVTVSANSGTITVTADTPVFSAGDVGSAFRMGGGVGTVTAYTSATEIEVELLFNITNVVPGTSNPWPALEGEWSLTPKFTVVSGLWHLEGEDVQVLADGSVIEGMTVAGGQITLPAEASLVSVGLPYVSQLQTLDLEVGDATIQGKFKKLSGLAIKVHHGRGWKYGPTWDNLVEVKQSGPTLGRPQQLVSGNTYQIMPPSWNVEGRICLQQDYPLPLTVLAVIPEVTVGSDPE